MAVAGALGAAIAALAGQGNGDRGEIKASQLEVAVLVRGRAHRTFRRIRGARLDDLLARARSGPAGTGGPSRAGGAGPGAGGDGTGGEPAPGDATAP
jgi:proteasome alpha subunit